MRLVGGRPRLTVKLRIEAHGPVLNLSSPILKSRVDLRLNRVGATPNRANPTPSRAEATPDGFDLGADQARRIDVDQRNGVDADLLVSRRLVPHRSQRGEIVEDVHPSDHPVGPQHRRVPGHFGVKAARPSSNRARGIPAEPRASANSLRSPNRAPGLLPASRPASPTLWAKAPFQPPPTRPTPPAPPAAPRRPTAKPAPAAATTPRIRLAKGGTLKDRAVRKARRPPPSTAGTNRDDRHRPKDDHSPRLRNEAHRRKGGRSRNSRNMRRPRG